jgi:hypothetical protein
LLAVPSREAWAYIAGFFDGEGHVTYAKGLDGFYRMTIGFTNTDESVMRWIHSQLPFGNLSTHVRPPNKPIWHLRFRRPDTITVVLDGMMPFLKVKAGKASELSAFIAKRAEFNSRP